MPRPHRPPELEPAPSSRVHRSQLHTLKRKRARTEHESHDSSYLQRARAQRRLFRNVRIHFQELPSTPKVTNVRSRRKRPKGNSFLQVVLAESLPPVKHPSTSQTIRSSVLVKEEADEGVSVILDAGVDHRNIPGNVPLEDPTAPMKPFAALRDLPLGYIPHQKNYVEAVESYSDNSVIDRAVSGRNRRLIQDGYHNNMPPQSLVEPTSNSQPVWWAPWLQTHSVSSYSPYMSRPATPVPPDVTARYLASRKNTPVPSLKDQSVSVWSARSIITDLRERDVSVWSAPPASYLYQTDREIPLGIAGALTASVKKSMHCELSGNFHWCNICGTSQRPLPYHDMPYHLHDHHGIVKTWTGVPIQSRESISPANNRNLDRGCRDCNAGILYPSYQQARRHLQMHLGPLNSIDFSPPLEFINGNRIHTLPESVITELTLRRDDGGKFVVVLGLGSGGLPFSSLSTPSTPVGFLASHHWKLFCEERENQLRDKDRANSLPPIQNLLDM